jgi:hypothetical protein
MQLLIYPLLCQEVEAIRSRALLTQEVVGVRSELAAIRSQTKLVHEAASIHQA